MNQLTKFTLALTAALILGMCTLKFPQLLAFEVSALTVGIAFLAYRELYRKPPTFNLTVERPEPTPAPKPQTPASKYDLALQRQKAKKDDANG